MQGSIRQIVLFDVADEIRLDVLATALGIESAGRGAPSSRLSPADYVRFERPPVIERLQASGLNASARYFDYGVVSLEIDHPFTLDWPALIDRNARLISDPDVEQRAMDLLRPRVDVARAALLNPYTKWLSEDYVIVIVFPETPEETADKLLATHGDDIAQIVRGEHRPLSPLERQEVLSARMSYYPNDLLVVGWLAAFVCDQPSAADPTLQLLEYANTQLLEYRHYDELLTGVLQSVYRSIERGTGPWRRWGLAARAESLNSIRLDIIEITERTEASIKFLGDMFYARMYQIMAARVGVPDYRRLVDAKLRTAGELYEFMVDRFDQGRGFVLELIVVIILLIEIVVLFWEKL